MSNKRWRDRKREGERERSPCAYIFRKTVFHIAMRRSVAYSRGPRTSGPRDPRAFAGRRGRTRSNTVKRAYASLEGGKACVYVCAWPGHTRVESRSNRRKRGQTPWLTKEEANYMYIRVYLRGLVRLLSPWNRPSLLFKRPSFHPLCSAPFYTRSSPSRSFGSFLLSPLLLLLVSFNSGLRSFLPRCFSLRSDTRTDAPSCVTQGHRLMLRCNVCAPVQPHSRTYVRTYVGR